MNLEDHLDNNKVEITKDEIKVRECIQRLLNEEDNEKDENDIKACLRADEPLMVCNLRDIIAKYQQFVRSLPQVKPFYAVKCNADKTVLRLLADLCVNFDCASKNEIRDVLEIGVAPNRIIFAHPCKAISHIQYAKEANVAMMTFDNEYELFKIKEHFSSAKLVLRLKVDDSKSIDKLGLKFGASFSESHQLLQTAKNLDLDVIGVSFHVGSRCYSSSAFYDAVEKARRIFDLASSRYGFNFHLLDIGGGFPGTDEEVISFSDAANMFQIAFKQFFPQADRTQPNSGNRIDIIAEPGRYFVTSAYTLICKITSMREIKSTDNNSSTIKYMYYLNDGVYGSLANITYDHVQPVPTTLSDTYKSDSCYSDSYSSDSCNSDTCSSHSYNSDTFSPDSCNSDDYNSDSCTKKKYESIVWGPTCDSLDVISKSVMLPKMSIGDFLCFENMGAYSMSASSLFNGFTGPKMIYFMTS